MRYGIPLVGDRVAPRSTFAESILIVEINGDRVTHKETVPLEGNTIIDLINVLRDYQVDTFVCGGISIMEIRELVHSFDITIIDNVIGNIDEIIRAIEQGRIHSGYGFSHLKSTDSVPHTLPPVTGGG